ADRVKLQLTDAAGRIAWQAEQVVDTEAYLQLRVQDEPLQRLGAGVYVLQVELGGTTLARQVVKAGR
ncbi:MAG: T9SS type A sorting domain-containing protein, partial [Flavobacteriales bacterium]|nr:T9SS type A sorting domain-containing protein [Flavobacteriales bacterium]MCB0785649.1 T9SS type A sorting domain-containing protein [Flavobacteriales bacterium]